jgi:serine/threonine protein kinase
MESDLNNYLRRDKLEVAQISFFTYQIFRALKYLHSSKIIHRDLKPANLTINEDWELRVKSYLIWFKKIKHPRHLKDK